ILLLTFISSSDLNQPTGATIMPPPEVHNTTMKVGPKTASCATVEDMGNDSFGDSWKESLRVRRLIRNHFDIHGGYVPNHLVVEHLQSHGYSVTWGKYPFGDYITYADFTFTLPEVKHLWRKNDCVRKYGRHLVMRADDFEKPSETNVLCSNWRKWKHPIIWFKGTTDAVASQFFLKNVHVQMRKSASTLFGSTGCLRSRPNVIGELLRVMISPSPDVQRIVNWVVNEGRDPHIAVHMRMLMNRSLRAVTTVLNCIKTTIARFPKDVVRPRVVLISDTPSLISDLMPKLLGFTEVLHFEYKKFKGNISGSAQDLGFRVKDWGPAPRWVAFVDFFLASRATHAVITGAQRRVGTTYAQLIAALAAAHQLDDDLDSPTNFSFISSFQNNLLHRGLQNQVGWVGGTDYDIPNTTRHRRMEAYGGITFKLGRLTITVMPAYCKAIDIIKKDLHDFINSFFASCDMPYGANSSFFTLIPKVNNPTLITDFRPISLIGIHYKIIAKILANRLSKVIDKIVSKEQSTFIAGPFDSISWNYLDHILDSLGFGLKWRSWIKTCLSSSRASILVNGSPTSEFSINRGLRQGDPLSPFLFILVMEGLHNAFADAVERDVCDDYYLAVDGNARDWKNIHSMRFIIWIDSNRGVIAGNNTPFNYLGLPIGSNMKSIASWKMLIDHFRSEEISLEKASLKLLTLLFSKNGAGGCSLLQMIYGLKSLKLFMVMKVVLIIMAAVSSVHGLTLLDPQTSFTRKALLFIRYNRLYRLDQDKDCLIIDRIINGQWHWNWSRTNIGVRNLAFFRDMLNEISQLNIVVIEDTCVWNLGPNGTFTVKDARNIIDQKTLPSLPSTSWDKIIPRKVNIFMWRLSLDRLPHRLNLSLRGMDIPAISCSSCNVNVEYANHVFFECIIASDLWKLVYKWCEISFVQALFFEAFKDWLSSWHALKEKKYRLFIISTSVLWWLWRFRNSVTFNSQPLRKSDIFCYVRSTSFSWLHNRGNLILSWTDWLKSPLMTACLDNG
ncbi:putative ribonuclease H protein, partial [Tanacetum coccineum]